MELTPQISRRNFYMMIWHAMFLALARVFMDVDTIIPAMMVDTGGSAIQIGILTAIMLGGASFTQLIYAPFVSNFHFKKKFLLLGINSRILSLLGMALLLLRASEMESNRVILLIFVLITIFSFGGAFANVSYTDILGKSVLQDSRKSFFSIKQVVTGILLFLSALLAKQVLNAFGYPINYAYSFFIACAALLVASFGFWGIKEVTPSRMSVKNPKHFFELIKKELHDNLRLKYFLGFINTMGISISLLPFIILYTKEFHAAEGANTGSFLFYKIIGSVATGFVLTLMAKKYKYRHLLYGSAGLAFILPLFILFSTSVPPFILIFFLGGIIFTTYNISMNGVLLELSDNENRTLYTGIAGAGNILPAIFPLLGGWIINQAGFTPFFLLFMAIILSSSFFVYKINCLK